MYCCKSQYKSCQCHDAIMQVVEHVQILHKWNVQNIKMLLYAIDMITKHLVYLSKAMVIDTHGHTKTRCMLESWHIQHQLAPLNRDRGTLPGLYAALLA